MHRLFLHDFDISSPNDGVIGNIMSIFHQCMTKEQNSADVWVSYVCAKFILHCCMIRHSWLLLEQLDAGGGGRGVDEQIEGLRISPDLRQEGMFLVVYVTHQSPSQGHTSTSWR